MVSMQNFVGNCVWMYVLFTPLGNSRRYWSTSPFMVSCPYLTAVSSPPTKTQRHVDALDVPSLYRNPDMLCSDTLTCKLVRVWGDTSTTMCVKLSVLFQYHSWILNSYISYTYCMEPRWNTQYLHMFSRTVVHLKTTVQCANTTQHQ